MLEILVTKGIKTRVANLVAVAAVEEAVELLTAAIVAVGIVSQEVR